MWRAGFWCCYGGKRARGRKVRRPGRVCHGWISWMKAAKSLTVCRALEKQQAQVIAKKEKTMSREDQFIPHLIVSDGVAALEFYKNTFGAEVGDNMMAQDGKRLLHGEIVLDGHKFFVSDEFSTSEGGVCKMPATLGGTSVRITLQT